VGKKGDYIPRGHFYCRSKTDKKRKKPPQVKKSRGTTDGRSQGEENRDGYPILFELRFGIRRETTEKRIIGIGHENLLEKTGLKET